MWWVKGDGNNEHHGYMDSEQIDALWLTYSLDNLGSINWWGSSPRSSNLTLVSSPETLEENKELASHLCWL